MPLTHVGGLSIPIRSAIYATTVVLHGRFETEAVLDELMDPARRITLVSLVPTMLARLLDAGLERPPTLRWALLGGGPIAPALLERAERRRGAGRADLRDDRGVLADRHVRLPAAGGRADHQCRARSRCAVRSSPPASSTSDGWLHTGDLGAFDDRGRLTISGRKSDTIVTGGENVAPAEVEAVLMEHPDVADVGVHGRPDDEWGEIVVAKVVTARRRGGRSASRCARSARRGSPATRCRSRSSSSPTLPRTGSGKLLRRRLR